MPSGREIRDRFGVGQHLEQRIVRYEKDPPPVPFRGFTDGSDECLPFFDEMEFGLTSGAERCWSVTGSAGCGKTTLARTAVVGLGRRFLAEPDRFPAVLQVDPPILRKLLEKDFRRDLALLGASLGLEEAEALARHRVAHPVIFIIDKDETAGLEDWNAPSLPLDQPFRMLHVALERFQPGRRTRLGAWEGEASLLAAHALAGKEGVARWNALAASTFAELRTYPLFVSWLLAQPSMSIETILRGAVVLDFLRDMHAASMAANVLDLPEWSEKLLWEERAFDPVSSRRLHVGPNGWGRAFEGGLAALALEKGRIEQVLRGRLLEPGVLELIARLRESTTLRHDLEQHTTDSDVVLTNIVNLLWRLQHTPIPDRFLKQVFRYVFNGPRSRSLDVAPTSGKTDSELLFRRFLVRLQGYRFTERLAHLDVAFADLSGAMIEHGARFTEFRLSSLCKSRIHGSVQSCSFARCRLGGARLERATFEDCRFRELGFPRGCLSGASRFTGCLFRDVSFGPTSDGSAIVFEDCELAECNLKELAAGDLVLRSCRLRNLSLEGCTFPRLEAPKAAFRLCNLEGLRSRNADLSRALFERSILANASLRGANLRNARLIQVDFQPGPGSRSGLTALPTRTDALHGSKSGFYAQDVSDGVYLDPELLRTADLRDSDLRGVILKDTDLFRVDLRGALLDPELRKAALTMQAFLE